MKTDRLLGAVFRIGFFSDGLTFSNILGFNRLRLMAGVSKIDIMEKKKRKRINVRKLNPEDRKRNAKKWLTQPKPRPKDLVAAYAKDSGFT